MFNAHLYFSFSHLYFCSVPIDILLCLFFIWLSVSRGFWLVLRFESAYRFRLVFNAYLIPFWANCVLCIISLEVHLLKPLPGLSATFSNFCSLFASYFWTSSHFYFKEKWELKNFIRPKIHFSSVRKNYLFTYFLKQ